MTAPVLPYGFARRFGVALTGDAGEAAAVVLSEAADPLVLAEVRRVAGRPLDVTRLPAAEFDRLLARSYAVSGYAADAEALGALESDIPSVADLLDSEDEAPVIRLINGLIAEAAREGASDIHIEPYDSALVVRMRADGQLAEKHRLPAGVAPTLVSRIKVMARLDIAERRRPQDGRISLNLGGKSLDVRVSTLPILHGERVVLRLLDKDRTALPLEALGMPAGVEQQFRAMLREPNGMVLVTGPTGSGKTTTLYAALKQLQVDERNIVTIEDPVEYAVEGIGQSQVNAKVGFTFAEGLRTILRQDPNTVMVGEIRDGETAGIAVTAALGSNLVLSSLHTNDAAGAVTRLRDLGVEVFALAATLRGIIAQRLVRRLCPECRVSVPATVAQAGLVDVAPGTPVMAPVGCDTCGGLGWQGRIGMFEVLRVDEAIRALIYGGGDEAQIAATAARNGLTLRAAARQLVLDGVTTPEEAARVTRAAADA